VDSKDIITLVVAVLIVAGIALFVHPSDNSVDNITPVLMPQTPLIQQNSSLSTEPYQITYNPNLDEIYVQGDEGYPRTLLPEKFDLLYWGSDVIGSDRWKEDNWVEFAYLHEAHGGLTRVFSVPYGIWRINTQMKTENIPQYAILRWALVDNDSGDIYQGSDIRYKGNSTRVIQNLGSRQDLYLIIASQNVDDFRLGFETLDNLYNPDTPIQIESVIK